MYKIKTSEHKKRIYKANSSFKFPAILASSITISLVIDCFNETIIEDFKEKDMIRLAFYRVCFY